MHFYKLRNLFRNVLTAIYHLEENPERRSLLKVAVRSIQTISEAYRPGCDGLEDFCQKVKLFETIQPILNPEIYQAFTDQQLMLFEVLFELDLTENLSEDEERAFFDFWPVSNGQLEAWCSERSASTTRERMLDNIHGNISVVKQFPEKIAVLKERTQAILSSPLAKEAKQAETHKIRRLPTKAKCFEDMRNVEMDTFKERRDVVKRSKLVGTSELGSCLGIGIKTAEKRGMIHWSTNFNKGFRYLRKAMLDEPSNLIGAEVVIVGGARYPASIDDCLDFVIHVVKTYKVIPEVALCLCMGKDYACSIIDSAGQGCYAIASNHFDPDQPDENFDEEQDEHIETHPVLIAVGVECEAAASLGEKSKTYRGVILMAEEGKKGAQDSKKAAPSIDAFAQKFDVLFEAAHSPQSYVALCNFMLTAKFSGDEIIQTGDWRGANLQWLTLLVANELVTSKGVNYSKAFLRKMFANNPGNFNPNVSVTIAPYEGITPLWLACAYSSKVSDDEIFKLVLALKNQEPNFYAVNSEEIRGIQPQTSMYSLIKDLSGIKDMVKVMQILRFSQLSVGQGSAPYAAPTGWAAFSYSGSQSASAPPVPPLLEANDDDVDDEQAHDSALGY